MRALAILSERAVFHMRRLAVTGPIVIAASVLTACSSPTGSYLLYGIGSELPARDIKSATTLLQDYFDYLCEQAGFGVAPGCALPLVDEAAWTLVVYQGMNDIDRRCDAYLAWLDNKKRSKGPLLSQVSAVRTTTEGIIGLTDPNSAKAIGIVGLAFQLLTDSIENYHSRLLLEIESSTINSVVLRARHEFRKAVRNKRFLNRPDAEYALREYLRRCLPFAIETQINDLSTLGSRGISATEKNTIFQEPVLIAKFAPVTDAGTRIRAFVRINQQNQAAVTSYLAQHHGGMSTARFVRNASKSDQLKMIQALNIP